MPNYALIDAQGAVVNRILLEDVAGWEAPAGLTLLQEFYIPYEIGGTIIAGVYTPPERPAPPPPPPVTAITPVQGRIALFNAGLLDKATAAVNAVGGATAIWWEYATVWERNNSLLTSMGVAIGLTSDQIDQLFIAAAQIK